MFECRGRNVVFPGGFLITYRCYLGCIFVWGRIVNGRSVACGRVFVSCHVFRLQVQGLV